MSMFKTATSRLWLGRLALGGTVTLIVLVAILVPIAAHSMWTELIKRGEPEQYDFLSGDLVIFARRRRSTRRELSEYRRGWNRRRNPTRHARCLREPRLHRSLPDTLDRPHVVLPGRRHSGGADCLHPPLSP